MEIFALWTLHVFGIVQPLPYSGIDLVSYGAMVCFAVTAFGLFIASLFAQQKSMAIQNLKKSESQVRDLLTSLPVMVWEIDNNMRLEFTNRRLNDFLGNRKIGDLASIIHPSNLSKVQTNLFTAWNQKQAFTEEVCCLDENGGIHWIAWSGVPRTLNGRFLGFLGIGVDITERVQQENAIKNSSLAKSRFIAGLSHEMRAPIGVIAGFSELMSETPLSPQSRDWLNRIRSNVDHILSLVNGVLDWSKVEEGSIQLKIERFCLREEIENLIRSFSLAAQEKGVGIQLNLAKDLPEYVVSDVLRFRQVVINLISNAVKFTASGGIAVNGCLLKCKSDISPEIIAIHVEDSGIGIEEKEHLKLFRPYVQTDATAAGNYPGTGLGLAISKRLAHALGGRLYLKHSSPQKGSCFAFEFANHNVSQMISLAPESQTRAT